MKAKRKKRRSGGVAERDEDGYIVVETVGAFIPFVLLVVSILSLVNIVTVQARVHYALTQAASTFSTYCYTLEVLGIANRLTALSNKADRVADEANAMRDDINDTFGGINSVSAFFGAVANSGSIAERASGWGEDIISDPQAALRLLMSYGLSELRNKFFEEMARPLVGRYLAQNGMTGDEYLRSVGVVNRVTGMSGLNALELHRFINMGHGNSVLIDAEGNVQLIAQYEIEYTFGKLPLPFSPTIRITQTVVTKAWLNGSGKGYW